VDDGYPDSTLQTNKGLIMSVALYKAGSTHTIKGIECEMKLFNENSFTNMLGSGWFYSPSECYEEATEPEDKLDSLDDNEVRSIAKECGIKNWHNKKIARLKAEIDAWQTET
jgi:hypothetical protein